MIRYIKLFLLLTLAVAMVLVMIANRDFVTVNLLPGALPGGDVLSIDLPLFILMIGMATGGFVLGWGWEYFREWRLRSESKQRLRKVEQLETEMTRLKTRTGTEEDDVLALLK